MWKIVSSRFPPMPERKAELAKDGGWDAPSIAEPNEAFLHNPRLDRLLEGCAKDIGAT